MLKSAIETLMKGDHLSDALCKDAIEEILSDDGNPLQIAAFLVLLRRKPETVSELSSIVEILREKMIPLPIREPALDMVGTGGDGYHTVNISTGSAILARSVGVKIVKHGNRRVSSLAGSADVLEAFGIDIDISSQKAAAIFEKIGITFCYFPNFHPDTLKLRALRQSLNVPTTFNFLGPLLNPAPKTHLILGVSDETLLPTMAEALKRLNPLKSFVVHGNGLDEISTVGPVTLFEVSNHNITSHRLDPKTYGFSYCKISDLEGGDAKKNASLLTEVFQGKEGPITDTLILNAAVAVYLYGLSASIEEAIPLVRKSQKEGDALNILNQWKACSHESTT